MTNSPTLRAVATTLPPNVIEQSRAKAFAETLFGPALAADERRLLAVFDSAGIERRHTCMPLEWFGRPHDLGETNALYIEHALALSCDAAVHALARAGLTPADVDHIVFVSSTGVSTPSLDARLANRLPLRGDVRRTPIWGLGCAGGAAGLAHARDFALADPDARVLLIAIELCSLTFQHGDLTRQNLVAASLFGDGAAAAVVAGARVPRSAPDRGGPEPASHAGGLATLELTASRSRLWPDTLDVMGWNVDAHGLHVVFSRDIPTIVRDWVRPNLEDFLVSHGLDLERLDHVVAHPGGPKVLAAYAEALGLPGAAFRHAYEVLRACGNMSSPTCLFVLERFLASGELGPSDTAVLAALGPGFSSELVLMRGTA
jgi:alkylresorcinol/alkylpyrone synthase